MNIDLLEDQPPNFERAIPEYWDISTGNLDPLRTHLAGLSKQDVINFRDEIFLNISDPRNDLLIKSVIKAYAERMTQIGAWNTSDSKNAVKELETEIKKSLVVPKEHNTTSDQNEEDADTTDNFSPIFTMGQAIGYGYIAKSGRTYPITNFVVISQKNVTDKEESQSRLLEIMYFDSNISQPAHRIVKITPSDIANIQTFVKAIRRVFMTAVINSPTKNAYEDMNSLWTYISNPANVPWTEVIAVESYGFSMMNNVQYFHHSERVANAHGSKVISAALTKKGDLLSSEVTYNGDSNKGLWAIAKLDEEVANDHFLNFIDRFPKMHNPLIAQTALGWMVSALLKTKVDQLDNELRIAILFVRGLHGVGKSVLMRILFNLFGYVGISGKGEEYGFKGSSDASIRDLLSSYATPMLIGEFKADDGYKSADMVTRILSVYDGMSSSIKKATSTGWEQSSSQYNSTLAMLSNDFITDGPARSRLLELHVTKEDLDMRENDDHYKILGKLPNGSVGQVVIGWALENWDRVDDVYEETKSLISDLLNKDHRTNNSIVITALGLKLVQKIIEDIGGTIPADYCDDNIRSVSVFASQEMTTHKSDTSDSQFISWLVTQINDNLSFFWDNDKNATKVVLPMGCISDYVRETMGEHNKQVNITKVGETIFGIKDVFSKKSSRDLNKQGQKVNGVIRLIIDIDEAVKKYDIDRGIFIKPKIIID